jgi:hypothetical protein
VILAYAGHPGQAPEPADAALSYINCAQALWKARQDRRADKACKRTFLALIRLRYDDPDVEAA